MIRFGEKVRTEQFAFRTVLFAFFFLSFLHFMYLFITDLQIEFFQLFLQGKVKECILQPRQMRN